MLISPRQLWDRLRHPRSRADELVALRARFRAQPSRFEVSAEAVAIARRLRELRRALSEALGHVDACHGCAQGHPQPQGRWEGGHCCGGRTLTIWSQEECAALKLAGTDAAALEPPRGDHAGCAFRGERGCSLAAEDRPSLCVRYVCGELRGELQGREDWAQIAKLASELACEQRRFTAAMAGELGTEEGTS